MSEELFDPYLTEDISPAHSEHWEAKRRVADALRQLNETLATSVPDTAGLHAIAGQLEETAARFARHQRIYGRFAYSEEGSHGNYGEVFHELSPVSGLSNPLSPPLRMWMEGDVVLGRVTLGWAYEGPPGCVHGGFVAALFDEFMGMAQHLGGQPGMTGTLSVRYQRPTPLNKELNLKGWLVGTDGRKTRIAAEMTAGDTVTARCEALFIRPRETMDKLRDAVARSNAP